ncbi:MAG: hypothetical protein AMXMBFR12_08550 [Candidatus Babeliales bacterium]
MNKLIIRLLLLLTVTNSALSMMRPLPPRPGNIPRPLPQLPIAKPVPTPAAAQPAQPQIPLQPQPPITSYKAAGILPFAVASNGDIFLLVGLENRSFKGGPVKAYAMDFGGKIDAQDSNNPAYSAAREGAEELAFIYDETPTDFKRVLDIRKKFGPNFNVNASGALSYKRILNKIQKDAITGKPALYNNNNNFYIMYFPRFSYDTPSRNVPQLYQMRLKQYGNQIPYEWREKSQLIWLPVKDIINAIKALPTQRAPLVVNGITIWPYVADSIIQAYQRGILNNLR